MNDNNNDNNVVKFPTKERRHEVIKERNKKETFHNPFPISNPNYRITSFTIDGMDWQKWDPPCFDSIFDENISFENIVWSIDTTKLNQPLLSDVMDACTMIQKQCIGLNDYQLNIVLDKLREILDPVKKS